MRLAVALMLLPALPFAPMTAPAFAQAAPLAGAQDQALLHFLDRAFDERLGLSPESQTQLGLNYGIENFWISCIVQFGLIHSVLLTIGLICFFIEVIRRSDNAVWAVMILIAVIAASSVSFSSKNIQLAQFVILISLLLPRSQPRLAVRRPVPARSRYRPVPA